VVLQQAEVFSMVRLPVAQAAVLQTEMRTAVLAVTLLAELEQEQAAQAALAAAQVVLLLTVVLVGLHLPTIQVATLVLAAQGVLAAAMEIPLQMAEVAETMEIVLLKAAALVMLVQEATEPAATVVTVAMEEMVVAVLVHHSYLQLQVELSQP
jgi:hypothetical protein